MALAYRTHTGNTSGNNSVPGAGISIVAGDLLVYVLDASGATSTPTSLTDNTSQTYTRVAEGTRGSSRTAAYVRDVIAGATGPTVSLSGTIPGASSVVAAHFALSGGVLTGLSAVRQQNTNTGPSGTPPEVTLSSAVLTSNLTLVAASPQSQTPPSGWTERTDQQRGPSGLETATRDSGFTGTTITWGANSGSLWAAIALELTDQILGEVVETATATDTATLTAQFMSMLEATSAADSTNASIPIQVGVVEPAQDEDSSSVIFLFDPATTQAVGALQWTAKTYDAAEVTASRLPLGREPVTTTTNARISGYPVMIRSGSRAFLSTDPFSATSRILVDSDLGTLGDFSIEFSARMTTEAVHRSLLGGPHIGGAANNGYEWIIKVGSGGFSFIYVDNGVTTTINDATACNDNAWHDYQVSRSGSTLYLLKDGVLLTSGSYPSSLLLNLDDLKYNTGDGNSSIVVWLGPLRISDVARNIANYTPRTYWSLPLHDTSRKIVSRDQVEPNPAPAEQPDGVIPYMLAQAESETTPDEVSSTEFSSREIAATTPCSYRDDVVFRMTGRRALIGDNGYWMSEPVAHPAFALRHYYGSGIPITLTTENSRDGEPVLKGHSNAGLFISSAEMAARPDISSLLKLNSGDFTIHGWFHLTSDLWVGIMSTTPINLSASPTASQNGAFSLLVTSSGFTGVTLKVRDAANTAAVTMSYMQSGGFHDSVWHHVAVVNDAGTLRLYVDGVQRGTLTDFHVFDRVDALFFASTNETFNGSSGSLQDWEVVKGLCLYPNGTSFTPPATLNDGDSVQDGALGSDQAEAATAAENSDAVADGTVVDQADGATAADSSDRTMDATGAQDEPASAADTPSATGQASVSGVESATAEEASDSLNTAPVDASEAATATEVSDRTATTESISSETATAAESADRTMTASADRAEAATAEDTSNRTSEQTGAASESSAAEESSDRTMTATPSQSDTATAAESSDRTMSSTGFQSEAATAAEASDRTATTSASSLESGAAEDSSDGTAAATATQSDSGTAAESVDRTMAATGTQSDAGAAAETADRSMSSTGTASEVGAAADSSDTSTLNSAAESANAADTPDRTAASTGTASEAASAQDSESVSTLNTGSDNASAQDTNAGTITATGQQSEAGNGTDTSNTSTLGTASEAGNAVEDQSQTTAMSGSQSEAGNAQDLSSSANGLLGSQSEPATAADETNRTATMDGAQSETADAQDSSDRATTTDAQASEAGNATDTAATDNTLAGTAIEAGAATDTQSVTAAFIAAQSESELLVDTGTATGAFTVSIAASATATDTQSAEAFETILGQMLEPANAQDLSSVANAAVASIQELCEAQDVSQAFATMQVTVHDAGNGQALVSCTLLVPVNAGISEAGNASDTTTATLTFFIPYRMFLAI